MVEALPLASASQLPPNATVVVTVTSASTQAVVVSAPPADAGVDAPGPHDAAGGTP